MIYLLSSFLYNLISFIEGYKVHLVCTGRFATGYVPARVKVIGEGAPPREKHVIVSFNGDDPQEPVQHIEED